MGFLATLGWMIVGSILGGLGAVAAMLYLTHLSNKGHLQ